MPEKSKELDWAGVEVKDGTVIVPFTDSASMAWSAAMAEKLRSFSVAGEQD